MDVTLHPVTPADLPAVLSLANCHLHDISEYTGDACNADGRFAGLEFVPTYWSDPNRFGFVLRCGEELAGFALVRGKPDLADLDYYISEFFVLRKFRHRGVGQRIAHQLFDRFRGRWMVDYPAKNEPAVRFWPKVVDRYCGGKFKERVQEKPTGRIIELFFQN